MKYNWFLVHSLYLSYAQRVTSPQLEPNVSYECNRDGSQLKEQALGIYSIAIHMTASLGLPSFAL